MRYCRLLVLLILVNVSYSYGQNFTKAIADNSFFIEESYNQEVRVVQNISTGYYLRESKTFIYSFTQEWPAFGLEHQLSFTLPYTSMGSNASGFGDIMLNYRYQLWEDGDWAWVSPRFSIILPTGSTSKGLGSGVVGAQICLPVSKRWSNQFVTHLNIGCTLMPNVENPAVNGSRKSLFSYFAGVSGIWLTTENFNFMLEAVYYMNAGFNEMGDVESVPQTILSPGVRFAINLGNLQIVPGFALPVTFASGKSEMNLFGYLSFEFPF